MPIELLEDKKKTKCQQVVDSIIAEIKTGRLKRNDKIPSINELSNECFLSRDTVQKAYELLEARGIISGVRGKGFYILRSDLELEMKILLLFNKMSNYKKMIYYSFIDTLGSKAVVDFKIHHCNAKLFGSIISNHLYDYDYFVVMPHFYEDAMEAYRYIDEIPRERLVIMDKVLPNPGKFQKIVYQDFQNDIVNALESALDALNRYNQLILVFPQKIPYPKEIMTGFRMFAMQNQIPNLTIDEIAKSTEIIKGAVYIVIEETDLVELIKNCERQNLTPGKDVGIISYNDTPTKEILLGGITVLSTDHKTMGETAAKMIIENQTANIKNPFSLILRKSL